MSKLKRNIMYNFTYQILILILPFITAPYLSRIIGSKGVGLYSFSHSVAVNFSYITMLGLSNYGNRLIATVQNNKHIRSKLFCEVYAMQVISFTLSITLYILYLKFFSVDKKAALIMSLWVLSSILDINWFFFGMELFKVTVIRNAIIKVGTVICIFVFIKNTQDIYLYITVMAIGMILSQLILWPFLGEYVYYVKPKISNIITHIKPNLMFFIPVIAISIYKIMDKVMLGYMSTMSEVGYYENAEKIIYVSLTLITAIGTVMLPRMTALVSADKFKESVKYLELSIFFVLFYTNAVTFGIFAVAKDFSIVYYGSSFAKSGTIMIYLATTIIVLGVGTVIRTQYLIPNKLDNVYIKSAIIGAIVNVLINIILIPHYASIGAAIGTIAAEVSVFMYQFNAVKKDIELVKYFKSGIAFFMFGIVMYLVIVFLPNMENLSLKLIRNILVGGGVYLLLSTVYIIKIKKLNFS